MNHPRIETKNLSDDTIKALIEVLVHRYFEERDGDDLSVNQAEAAIVESYKLERFLDR